MDFIAEEERDGVRWSWNVWPSNKVDAAKMVRNDQNISQDESSTI